ncbi:poly(rC)-binding protein 3-like isoform X3 [Homarus americanus]|uniref:poly(rC)-binding protein 3-like isoform X3 n=1 Tax=Homarus americanus TaxID=6706 RepID=UPI001C466958|nr:poly(rC)-binding protein 3-like isoform X3 [Homarus americanus]
MCDLYSNLATVCTPPPGRGRAHQGAGRQSHLNRRGVRPIARRLYTLPHHARYDRVVPPLCPCCPARPPVKPSPPARPPARAHRPQPPHPPGATSQPPPGLPHSAIPDLNMATIDSKPLTTNDGPSASLSMRLLMQGKEVGSIIGKKGEIVKRFREESGAKINISDGSCPERIVTVTGNTDSIFTAFKLICAKFEEFLGQMYQNNGSAGGGGGGQQRPPITLRLIVPASQCGSLIGKAGSKIKEIREVTGASIQVASEMLPNSTERAVTVSGTSEAITQCIYNICCVMLESPPKGATIPYRPKPQVAGGPVILAGGQAYTIQGNYAVPSAPDMSKLGNNSPLAGLLGLGSLAGANPGGGVNPHAGNTADALAALAGSQLRTPAGSGPGTQTHEMTVPNELIGCIIGKGGTKIAEIRQITGAMITISKYDDGSEEASKQDRTISIKGNADQVALAQYLINTRIAMETAGLGMAGVGYQYIAPNHIVRAPIH